MKKTISVVLAISVIFALFGGCAERGNNVTGGNIVAGSNGSLVGNIPVTFPLVDNSADINILATGYDGIDQKQVYVWQEYEKMTGVNVNWTTLTKEERAETVHNALTNNQNFDLILRCKISAVRLSKYGKSGLVLDLAKDGMLKKYAPNCWAYLQSHPDTLASVMNPDGTIYGLPQVNSGAELRVAQKIFINKKWLEKLKLDVPTTTEEFKKMLEAFKKQDANGNGDKTDEIPLCSPDWTSINQALYGAFGLCNRGYHNERIDADPKTGNVRFIAASNEYKEFVSYMHELYSEELIDKNNFNSTTDYWLGKINNDKVGAFTMTNLAWLPTDLLDNWVAVDEALTGPGGDKMWTAIRANFHSTGAAVIPATCSNPELVLRWLDYFWTDEGTLFYHMGIEGKTYNKLDDGTYDYVSEIYKEAADKNIPFDDIVANYSPYPGGSNPTVEIAPYFMGGEMAPLPAKTAVSLFKYGPKEYWPSFTFDAEDNDKIDVIKADLEKYCDNMMIEFVTGQRPLTDWDEYKAQLKKMKVDEFVGYYEEAVDRYHALVSALK